MATIEPSPTAAPHKQAKKTLVAGGVTQYTTVSPKGAFLGGVLFATVIAVIVSLALYKSHEREVDINMSAAHSRTLQVEAFLKDANQALTLNSNAVAATCEAFKSLVFTVAGDVEKQANALAKLKRSSDPNLKAAYQDGVVLTGELNALLSTLKAHPDTQCAADTSKGAGPILWQHGDAVFRATGWQSAPGAVSLPTDPTPAQVPVPALSPPAAPGVPQAEPNAEPKK